MFLFVTGVWVVRPCVIVWEGEVGMLHLKLEILNFQKRFFITLGEQENHLCVMTRVFLRKEGNVLFNDALNTFYLR